MRPDIFAVMNEFPFVTNNLDRLYAVIRSYAAAGLEVKITFPTFYRDAEYSDF